MNRKLLNPFFQTKYCYLVLDGDKQLGQVFVLDPKYVKVSEYRKGLQCVRREPGERKKQNRPRRSY